MLTRYQRDRIEPLLAHLDPPRRQAARRALSGIFRVMRTGERWKDLPARYGSGEACRRQFGWMARRKSSRLILEELARLSPGDDENVTIRA